MGQVVENVDEEFSLPHFIRPNLGRGLNGRKHGLVVRQAHHEAYWSAASEQRLILSLSKDEARWAGY
ncbi:MAG: hypothetical protein B7Y90_18980 [Alphaproteobacteria bacterium 32-64-14]|nr:MAG: hypothetical protein B7Y90_18980 [Alphaproteobacteria bacterium 32-64-14]